VAVGRWSFFLQIVRRITVKIPVLIENDHRLDAPEKIS
jgi:hypothetical protein